MGKMEKLNLGFITFINNFLKILSCVYLNLLKWLLFLKLTLWQLSFYAYKLLTFKGL